MRIVLCIKPVKSELVNHGEVKNEVFVMNPYDLFALENCLELKKKSNCQIICVCMGPMSSKYLLIKAIAMGVDEVVLLNDNIFIGSDTVATSYILTKAINKLGNIDMVVCGEKSIDGETGQVVYGISERLKYNCLTNIGKIIEIRDKQIILEKIDNKMKTIIQVNLPISISFSDFKLSQPNISLINLKRAKTKKIIIWGAVDIEADNSKCGLNGSKTKVLDIKSQLSKKQNTKINGTIVDKAQFIHNFITKR